MIYFASYFRKRHHHGRLVSISNSTPKGFRVDGKLSFLVPPWDLLQDWQVWKEQTPADFFPMPTHLQEYKRRYWAHIRPSRAKLERHLHWLTHRTDETWLCWEHPGNFCHRYLVMQWLMRDWPDYVGGADTEWTLEDDPPIYRLPALQTT